MKQPCGASLQRAELTGAPLALAASRLEALIVPYPCGCAVQNRHFRERNVENSCDSFQLLPSLPLAAGQKLSSVIELRVDYDCLETGTVSWKEET